MREAAKVVARGIALLAALPFLASFAIRKWALGSGRALEGSTQALAIIPGLVGSYLRRAFLSKVLERCDSSSLIEFGTLFSQVGARIDENVYVGPRCQLGLVHLERGVLLAAGVQVPSGPRTHGTQDSSQPIRDQPQERALVRIGEGTWVGSAAVILADVGKHSVIGAGAVVTHPIPDYVVAAGVPARVIKNRRESG